MTAEARLLPDGRLHLHHGPMDLIVAAWGDPRAVDRAFGRAWARFRPLLDELVRELPALRSAGPAPLKGKVAKAMAAAVAPFRPAFITPMAAVAGAVADEILAALVADDIAKACVNNGGDIALHLAPGESLSAAIAARPGLPDRVTIRHEDPVRGIATSGWRGRSFSLGLADAATILAPDAAMADAAATVIANATDLPGHPAVTRRPACTVKADSDLGTIPVTTDVGPLGQADRAAALDAGLDAARAAHSRGLLEAAALFVQGEHRLFSPSSGVCFLFPTMPAGPQGTAHRRIAAGEGETHDRKEPALA